MLLTTQADTFVAECDVCRARAEAIEGSRQLAITRLMLKGWQVRSLKDGTRTTCNDCVSIPSIRSRPNPPAR